MIKKASSGCRVPWLGTAGIAVLAALVSPARLADSAEEAKKPDAAKEAKADWVVYVEDGLSGTHAVDLLPASSPLENYTANLARISPAFSEARHRDGDCSVPGAYDPENITVTEIGPWHGYTVFDLANIPAKHRSIVLKDQQGNHRILYTQVCWGSATFDDTPHFVTAQEQALLVYRSETGGSAGNFTEYYFLYDPETRQPVALLLDPIKAKIKEIIPYDRIVWDAGGFDIATLTYSSQVWRKSDPCCCPTAGRVTMKLEIRDKALVVTEAKYDPDAKAK